MSIYFVDGKKEVAVHSRKEVLSAFKKGSTVKINNVTYNYDNLKLEKNGLYIYMRPYSS